MRESPTTPLPTRLAALAAYLPVFEDPDFEFATLGGGNRLEDGAVQVPFTILSEQASEFVRTTYDHGWTVAGFDWNTWIATTEASSLFGDPAALAAATPAQIERLLTALVRQDRFDDGALYRAYTDGLLTRVVRRAAQLLHELKAAPPAGDDIDAFEAFYQDEIWDD